MTAECGPGREETGRLLANLFESRSKDNSPGSRETEIRMPAPLLDYNRIGDKCSHLSRDLQMWLKCGSTHRAERCAWGLAGPQEVSAHSHLRSPCLFTACCSPHHTPIIFSLPFFSPHAQSDTCCFCCSNVSHIHSLLSIELLHQGNFQLL